MKEIVRVLVEKLKEIEAPYAALGLGIFGIITLICGVSIVNNFIDMIVKLAEVIAGKTPIG